MGKKKSNKSQQQPGGGDGQGPSQPVGQQQQPQQQGAQQQGGRGPPGQQQGGRGGGQQQPQQQGGQHQGGGNGPQQGGRGPHPQQQGGQQQQQGGRGPHPQQQGGQQQQQGGRGPQSQQQGGQQQQQQGGRGPQSQQQGGQQQGGRGRGQQPQYTQQPGGQQQGGRGRGQQPQYPQQPGGQQQGGRGRGQQPQYTQQPGGQQQGGRGRGQSPSHQQQPGQQSAWPQQQGQQSPRPQQPAQQSAWPQQQGQQSPRPQQPAQQSAWPQQQAQQPPWQQQPGAAQPRPAWGAPRPEQGPQPQATQPQAGQWGSPRQEPQAAPHQQTQQVPHQQQAASRAAPHQQTQQVPHQQQAAGKGPQRGQGRRGPGGDHPGQTQSPVATSPPGQIGTGDSAQMERALVVADLQSHIDKMSLKQPQRQIVPGTRGKKIQLESNHLTINLGRANTVFHYDVAMVPDKPKRFLRPAVEAFRAKMFPKNWPAYDGKKSMYSCKKLADCEGEVEIDTDDGSKKTYKITIKHVASIDLSPLHNLLDTGNYADALQALNVVLRSAPARNCIPVGNSFFRKPAGIIELGNGMEMYQGFYQSAIRGGKLLLNVDVAHKAFPKSINCINALVEVCSDYRNTLNPSQPLSPDNFTTFRKYMSTLRVMYEIPGQSGSKRTFSVNGLGDPADRAAFTLSNGSNTTVANYFKTMKRYIIKYPHLPTLWVGSRERKVLVPMECCTICPGQAVNRSMNENQTSAMIKYAATSAPERKNKILAGVKQANYNQENVLKEFGVSVGDKFQSLEGRVLNPPMLEYGSGKVTPQKGVWRNLRFLQSVTIDKWMVAYTGRGPPPNIQEFVKLVCQESGRMGIKINPNPRPPKQVFNRDLKDVQKFFHENTDYQIIFVIVPNSGPTYSYVKTASEILVGTLTQCLKVKTMNRINNQTVANILLKVNSKLTGVNHNLSSRPPIMNKPCMIMGADVTHPSPDSTDIPSVAAVVASNDPKASSYNICWRLQSPKVEIIEDLKNIVKEQLFFFYKTNAQQKPYSIIFFRDGVSEGQFDEVRNVEIRAIQQACREMSPDYNPPITFVVVQKRHHTRLFPLDERDSHDRNKNVPAGTCVDHTILSPTMQSFYLVSHASIQGVAKPTKYCTIWDDNNLSNDDIEDLAYYLCHMFNRCTRSVSYPAPTYYAHLAAARGKVYIENERSLDMTKLANIQNKYKIQDKIRKDLPMFFI